MQEYEVILTIEAVNDVVEIAEYIEIEFGEVLADRFQAKIKEEIESLRYMAGVFVRTPILYREYYIYKKVFPPSIIFYIIKEQEVHVLRVLREERNWKRILSIQQGYTYQ